MDELKKENAALPITPAKEQANPELTSVKRLLTLLDKTARSSRTYGAANPVAQNLFQQLFDKLTTHLATYSKLAFLVQRSELHFNGEVAYRSEQHSQNESVAFKLYADGIRELTFLDGLLAEDLAFLLDALWDSLDPEKNDDDIVTRLWSKNLSTITTVTAEEIAKGSSHSSSLVLPTAGMMIATLSLRDILDHEQAKAKHPKGLGSPLGEKQAGGGSEAEAGRFQSSHAGYEASDEELAKDEEPAKEGTGAGRFQSGHVGYEVSDQDLAKLAKEIEAESTRDNTTYLLNMLAAILASEKSPEILTKLVALWGTVLDSLMAAGQWASVNSVLRLLRVAPEIRPDLDDNHKKQLVAHLDSLNQSERIKMIETYLNTTPNATIEGLSATLLSMTSASVPALCSLLENLKTPAHQTIVAEALVTLAKDQPDPVLRDLSNRPPHYVKHLLAILLKWNNPQFADSIEKLRHYPDPQVRRDFVRAIGVLRPNGNGTKLVALMNDAERPVRWVALKLLMTGQYTAPYSAWSPHVSVNAFMDRTLSENRAIFHAMRATSGDEVIPFFERLFTEWAWTNRKKRNELAVLAAEALGKLVTPAALTTLEMGRKNGGAPVRQACTAALAHAQRQQQLNRATSQ